MENNKKIYTILSVFALSSLVLIVFFVWPLLKDIDNSSKDLVFARNGMAALRDQTSQAENFKQNYQAYKFNLERIDQMFVDQNNPVNFIEFLENTAYSQGVSAQVSLLPYSQSPQQFIMMQLVSKGGFSNISNFLKKVEAGPYLLEIESLTIQNSQDSKAIPKDYSLRQVDATFGIKIFVKK